MSFILVVEDEPDILELIRYNLEKEGYTVEGAVSGEDALELLSIRIPALIILDLMLPGVDGWEVCRRLKTDPERRTIPVMMLTARTEDSDIVTGLDAGADDYVTKPFNPKVLIARVRAALRRSPSGGSESTNEEVIVINGIEIDIARHRVRCGRQDVPLSATEFAILEFLSRNPGWVFSRARIIDAIRGEDYPVTERSVDVQILGLRRKLGACGQVIETVRGVGYRMQGA
ncbi:MAG: DNA-binding response regulator [Spirochaetaceae bacterium]|nr:MAG: DNA-binding response regulator [Spirochaetaceae bacterium]